MPAAQIPAVRVNICRTTLLICDSPGRLTSAKLEACPQKHLGTHKTGLSFIRETEHICYRIHNTTRGIVLRGSIGDADRSGSTPETAGDVQTDLNAVEAGAGAGEQHEEDSHEVEVVERGSDAGVPAIKPAPVYNKQGGVVEVTQGIIDAVDKFTPPTDFMRKRLAQQVLHVIGIFFVVQVFFLFAKWRG